MPQVPDKACPSQATVADIVVAKYMYIYVNSPIFGPPADKRDLTTFGNMLGNKHFKSVKNHDFFTVFKQVSSMCYA